MAVISFQHSFSIKVVFVQYLLCWKYNIEKHSLLHLTMLLSVSFVSVSFCFYTISLRKTRQNQCNVLFLIIITILTRSMIGNSNYNVSWKTWPINCLFAVNYSQSKSAATQTNITRLQSPIAPLNSAETDDNKTGIYQQCAIQGLGALSSSEPENSSSGVGFHSVCLEVTVRRGCESERWRGVSRNEREEKDKKKREREREREGEGRKRQREKE